MPLALVRSWWMLGTRGVVAVLFGLAALLWRDITLGEFVLLFGAYVFVDGLVAIVSAFRAAERLAQGWPLLVEGGVSVILGVIAWAFPMIPFTLLYLIASWGIVTGVLAIVAAMGLALEPTGRWLLGSAGASSVLLGMILMMLPAAGAIEVVRMVGVYALVFGVLVLMLAVRLRGWRGGLVHATP